MSQILLLNTRPKSLTTILIPGSWLLAPYHEDTEPRVNTEIFPVSSKQVKSLKTFVDTFTIFVDIIHTFIDKFPQFISHGSPIKPTMPLYAL